MNVCTTDDFTNCVDALVYLIDPEAEEMNIVYPSLLFDRNVTAGRATSCSFLPLAVGNNQSMGDAVRLWLASRLIHPRCGITSTRN